MIWQHFIEQLSLLARRIEGRIEERPDIIVSMIPNGMISARILAAKLSVSELYGLRNSLKITS